MILVYTDIQKLDKNDKNLEKKFNATVVSFR